MIILNRTYTHVIENVGFGGLSFDIVCDILKDGRAFSHFIEPWIANNYPLVHISGCKSYDFEDKNDPRIKYDEKTFTKNGCKFMPSSMIGTGRKFNNEVFQEKTKDLIFCIVSNINFPEIKIRFIKGETLLQSYPKGEIPFSDHIKLFE